MNWSSIHWIAAVAAALSFSVNAQINLVSDVITFRTNTSSDKDKTTTHYGNVELHGNGAGSTYIAPLQVFCDYTGTSDREAIYSYCMPASAKSWGAYLRANYCGIKAYATGNAGVSPYGGSFTATASSGTTAWGIYSSASGGSTNWGGYFLGSSGIYVNGTTYPSDAKFKVNMQPMDGYLEKVMQLKPQTYYYDTTAYKAMCFSSRKQFGLIAQDVEQVFPEIVTDVTPPDTNAGVPGRTQVDKAQESFKGVNYVSLIPVLVAAIQEQQAAIKQQQREIDDLKALLAK